MLKESQNLGAYIYRSACSRMLQDFCCCSQKNHKTIAVLIATNQLLIHVLMWCARCGAGQICCIYHTEPMNLGSAPGQSSVHHEIKQSLRAALIYANCQWPQGTKTAARNLGRVSACPFPLTIPSKPVAGRGITRVPTQGEPPWLITPALQPECAGGEAQGDHTRVQPKHFHLVTNNSATVTKDSVREQSRLSSCTFPHTALSTHFMQHQLAEKLAKHFTKMFTLFPIKFPVSNFLDKLYATPLLLQLLTQPEQTFRWVEILPDWRLIRITTFSGSDSELHI